MFSSAPTEGGGRPGGRLAAAWGFRPTGRRPGAWRKVGRDATRLRRATPHPTLRSAWPGSLPPAASRPAHFASLRLPLGAAPRQTLRPPGLRPGRALSLRDRATGPLVPRSPASRPFGSRSLVPPAALAACALRLLCRGASPHPLGRYAPIFLRPLRGLRAPLAEIATPKGQGS